MSQDFNRKALTVVVAQICQTIGWHSINSTPLDMLVDLLHRYLLKIGENAHRYAEQLGHTQPDLDDLGLAFMDMGISVEELQEYVQCVDTVPFVKEVPKYPIPRESHLNFLKPGSKEVVTRPVYVHEHLPPMHPELEGEEYNNENAGTPTAEANSPVNGFSSGPPSVAGSNGSQGTGGSGGQTSAPNSGPSSPSPNGGSAGVMPNPFKRPSDPVFSESPAAKRARLTIEEEGRPLREISSVMMTTSGFLSPAREGKLPESRTPIAASDLRPTSPQPSHYPAVPPLVNKEKKIPKKVPVSTFRFVQEGKKKNAFLPPDLPLDYSNVAKLDSMKELGKLKALKPPRRSLPPGVSPAPKLPKKAIPKVSNRLPGGQFAKNSKVVRTLIPEKNPFSPSPEIPIDLEDPLSDSVTKLTASPDKHKLNIFKKISKGADDKVKRDSNLVPVENAQWNAEPIDRKPLDTTVSDCIENVIRKGMEEVDKAEALLKEVKKEKDVSTSSDSFIDVTGTSPLPSSPPLRTFKSPDPVVQSAQRKIKREERVMRKLEKAKNKAKKVDDPFANPLFISDDVLALNEPLKNSHYPIVKMPKPKKRKKERPEESTWEIRPPRQHFAELQDYSDYQRMRVPGLESYPPLPNSPAVEIWTPVPERSPTSPPVQILPPEVRSPIHTIDITSPERPVTDGPSCASTPVTSAMSPDGLTTTPATGTTPIPALRGVSVSLVQVTSPTATTEPLTSPTKKKLGLGKLKSGEKDPALMLSPYSSEDETCEGQTASPKCQREFASHGSLVLVLKKEHKKDKKEKKDKIKKKKEKKDKHKAKEKDPTKKKEEGKKNKDKKKKKKKEEAAAGAAAASVTSATVATPVVPTEPSSATGLSVHSAPVLDAPARSITPQPVPSAPEAASALPRITLKLSSGTPSPPPDAPTRKAAAKIPKKTEVPYQPELFSSTHFIESEAYRREKEKEKEREREREKERERERELEIERERELARERERLLEEERERLREREREEERERERERLRKEKEREWAREMEEKERAEAQARSSTSLPATSPPVKSSKSKSSKTHKYPSTGMRFAILPEIPPSSALNKEKKKKKKTSSSHRDVEEPSGYSPVVPMMNHTYAPTPIAEAAPVQPVYTNPVAPVVYEENEGNKVWICPSCNGPDDGRPMIGCDGCDEWYHWVCVGIKVPPDENEDWFCTSCISRKESERVTKKKKKSRKKKQGT